MKKRISFKGVINIFKNCFKGFGENKIPRLSGSLAYSTVFSMGPLLVVIISVCGIFLGKEAVEGKIYAQLAGFVGADTAAQLEEIIKNAAASNKNGTAAMIGGIILLVCATAIFGEIQDSINSIWGIKPKPKKGWLKIIQNRLLSFSVIVGLGFLLLVSLSINTLIDGFGNSLKAHFPGMAVPVFYVVNNSITFIVTTLIFGVIFKVLPDATIRWKDIIVGAIATALLFMLGKMGISYYISKAHVGSTYGAAGSLVILLSWIYYSALILYFGAEFTKAYVMEYGDAIYPNTYAVTTKVVEVETGKKSVQETENITVVATPEKKP